MRLTVRNITNQQGFSLDAGLGLVAVAGLLILLGIYVHKQQAHSESAAKQSNQQSPKFKPPKPATPASGSGAGSAASQSGNKVIKVPALGADLTEPNSLKDLTYYVTSDSGGHVVINFSTKTLAAAVPACAANQGSGAFDQVERGNGQYPGPANPSSGGLLKQYPTYYLAYILPDGPCAHNLSTANQNLLDAQAQAFYTALSTIQASP